MIIEFEHLGDLSPVIPVKELESLGIMTIQDSETCILELRMKSGQINMIYFENQIPCIVEKKRVKGLLKQYIALVEKQAQQIRKALSSLAIKNNN